MITIVGLPSHREALTYNGPGDNNGRTIRIGLATNFPGWIIFCIINQYWKRQLDGQMGKDGEILLYMIP